MSINEEGHPEPGSGAAGAGGQGGADAAAGAGRAAGAGAGGVPGAVPGAGAGESSSRAFDSSSKNLNDLDTAVAALEALELIERQVSAARVNALALADRAARCEANKFSKSTAAAEDSIAYRAARAEIATALHFSEPTIERHMTEARALAAQYAATVSALECGDISYRHATVILHAGEVIGEVGIDDTSDIAAQRALYEERVLIHAVDMTPNRLKPIARRIAEEYATRDLDERYESERALRRVWVTERDNGMAELGAYLPAHEAYGIHSRLTQIAKQIESVERRELRESYELREREEASGVETSTEPEGTGLGVPVLRRRDEIRADLLSDFLLNSTGDSATGGPGVGITGIVQVVTHTGHVQEQQPTATPGASQHPQRLPIPELEGYGPIPVGVARIIAGGGSADGSSVGAGSAGGSFAWNLVTANPMSGDVLRVERYRPSEEMRRYLTARDQHCRFPGCRGAAYRGDADHTIDAALGGATATSNLGILCRGHHTIKHHSGWKVKQEAYGVYEWTSPTGRVHVDTPVSRVRFAAAPAPPRGTRPPNGTSPTNRIPPPIGTSPPNGTGPPHGKAPPARQSSEEPEVPF